MAITQEYSQPEAMTDAECLEELSQLLARGLVRVMKKSEKYCRKPEISEHNCLAVPGQIGPDVADN